MNSNQESNLCRILFKLVGIYIKELRTKLLKQMRAWIMECLDLELDEDTLDLFCAKYRHTDTLLCHDDELEVIVVIQYVN